MAERKSSGKFGSGSKSNTRIPKKTFGKSKSPSSKENDKDSRTNDDEKPKRSYNKDDSFGKDKYSASKKEGSGSAKRTEKRPRKTDGKTTFGTYKKEEAFKRPRKSFDDKYKKSDSSYGDKKPYDKDAKKFDKPFSKNDKYKSKKEDDRGPYKRPYDKSEPKKYGSDSDTKRFKKDDFKEGKGFGSHNKDKKDFKERTFKKNYEETSHSKKHLNDDGLIRLNKYLANAGISSRRDADTLILGGTVKVNGVVVDQMGYKVKPGDVVTYADSAIKNERKVYLILNKPKDFITTTDDPQERRTVMELIRPACKERIYPVGRLDRNTTGLLLFTNDGDIATKLMHPKHQIRKVYHVSLNKPLRGEDYKAIGEGLTLDDGPVKVDDIAFVGEGKKEIGLEIHSGKNRIVRRMFEHLGYEVIKLDRVSYAGLTKKDLPRGKYRFLTDKEISFLKMLG